MYTIPTKELKKFFSASSFVSPAGQLPILDYMLIRCGKEGSELYRTDLNSYYIQYVDVENTVGDVVVEYKSLAEFVKNVSSEAITFTAKDDKILISDGKGRLLLPTMSAIHFPRIPEINKETSFLSEDVVTALKRASLFLDLKNVDDLFVTHVFIGKGWICASDRSFAHYAPLETTIEAALYKKAIMAMPESCNFSISENYFTFSTLSQVFMFSKTEAKFFNMSSVPATRPKETTCVINRAAFLQYLTIARGQCKYGLCAIDIKGSEPSLYCHMVDPMYGAIWDEKIEANSSEFEFRFNADYMLTIVKQFYGELLHFYLDGHKLFITDEHNNFLTIIMQIHDISK